MESPGEGEGTDQTLNYYKNSHPLQGCHPQAHRKNTIIKTANSDFGSKYIFPYYQSLKHMNRTMKKNIANITNTAVSDDLTIFLKAL